MKALLSIFFMLIGSICLSQQINQTMVITDFDQAIVKGDRAYVIKETAPSGQPLILFNRFDQHGNLVESGHFFNGKTHDLWYRIEGGRVIGIAIYSHGRLIENITVFEGYADCYTRDEDSVTRRRIRPDNKRWHELMNPKPDISIDDPLHRFMFADL